MQLLEELARKQAKLLENLCEKTQLPSFLNITIWPLSNYEVVYVFVSPFWFCFFHGQPKDSNQKGMQEKP